MRYRSGKTKTGRQFSKYEAWHQKSFTLWKP